MNYGKLFDRAFNIVWTHKFLILLGVLAAFSSGTGSSHSGAPFMSVGSQATFPGSDGSFFVAPAVAVLLLLLVVAAGFLLYLLGTIARGALIMGVDAAERGEVSSFGRAWRAGWRRAITLIAIGLVPALPLLLGGLLGLAGYFFYAEGGAPSWLAPPGMGTGTTIGLLTCLVLPLSLLLGLLRTLANRAAMLDGLGMVAAYTRGLQMLVENAGPAFIIFVLQVGTSLLFLLPGIAVGLCFPLWPLLWLAQGLMAATFSAVWTLAWKQWTGAAVAVQPSVA